MNYTKTIRQYCLQNPGQVFDVSREYKTYFNMIPYKTFCKILNRLETEGVIKSYSKGVFLICNNTEGDDPIISFYASEDTGMVVGYALYNELGITEVQKKPIEIYTMAMETTTKNIGNEYRLIKLPMNMFDTWTKKIIVCLELIEHRHNILEVNIVRLNEVIIEYSQYYQDSVLKEITRVRKYSYGTYCTFATILNELHIPNHAVEIGMSILDAKE